MPLVSLSYDSRGKGTGDRTEWRRYDHMTESESGANRRERKVEVMWSSLYIIYRSEWGTSELGSPVEASKRSEGAGRTHYERNLIFLSSHAIFLVSFHSLFISLHFTLLRRERWHVYRSFLVTFGSLGGAVSGARERRRVRSLMLHSLPSSLHSVAHFLYGEYKGNHWIKVVNLGNWGSLWTTSYSGQTVRKGWKKNIVRVLYNPTNHFC